MQSQSSSVGGVVDNQISEQNKLYNLGTGAEWDEG